MKETSDCQSFTRNIGISSISAAILPVGIASAEDKKEAAAEQGKPSPSRSSRAYNGSYTKEYLNRVAFLIEGTGAGIFLYGGYRLILFTCRCRHGDL